jgi:DNA-binding GntR family transcriptional regulator
MRNAPIFQPLRTNGTLRDHTVELITEAIFSGKIKPGERLNESQLARDLHVSRAPVREALQQLQEQSLIVNVPRRGMFVVNLDERDIEEINSVRIVLEAEALRLARLNLTPPRARKLKELLAPLEGGRLLPVRVSARSDLDFHRTIWNCSGNRYLERTLISLTAPLFAHASILLSREKLKAVLESHRPLLDFICGKSSMTGEDIMRCHLARYSEPAAPYPSNSQDYIVT